MRLGFIVEENLNNRVRGELDVNKEVQQTSTLGEGEYLKRTTLLSFNSKPSGRAAKLLFFK